MVHGGPSGVPDFPSQDGRNISVASTVESIVGCKWSVGLLRLLVGGCHRPSALLRGCPGLSAKVMNERFRKMTRFGILQRTVLGNKPPVEVQYRLTDFGRRFMRILDEVRRLQEVLDGGAVPDNGGLQKEAIRSNRLARRRSRRQERPLRS